MEGRIAEALSIPAQQTTRYAHEHRDEVTEEEYSVLSEFFDDYDALGPGYYGEVADGAKARIIDNPPKNSCRPTLKCGLNNSVSIRILMSRRSLTRLMATFISTGTNLLDLWSSVRCWDMMSLPWMCTIWMSASCRS